MSMFLRGRLLGGTSWRSFAQFSPDDPGAGGGAPAPAPVPAPAPAPAAAPAPAPAPAPSPAPAAPPTIAGGGAPAPVVSAQAKWPDSWRQDLAGDDKTQLAQLERLGSPTDIWKSYRELQAKVSSGELKAPAKPLGPDAKPEEVAAWRKEQGLPETPEAILGGLKLPDGLVPSERDKPLLEGFAKNVAIAGNLNQEQVNSIVGWYFGEQAKAVAEQQRSDGQFHHASTVSLAQEWGKDYETNVNAIANLTNTLPEAIRDSLLTARLPNGNVVGDDPNFNKSLLMWSKQINPAASLLPNINGGGLSGVESRIAEIETKHMRASPGTPEWRQYWQGDGKMGEEYRQLLEARETMQSRAKTAA